MNNHDDGGAAAPVTPAPQGRRSEEAYGIDWDLWRPDERAVIVYIIDREKRKLLLIHKKTGLGKGKVNAPGGRLESGESFLDAAIRECREEVSLTPLAPEKRAELRFQFTSGYALYGEAFFTDSWEGEERPSAEADPFWCDLGGLPWDNMWEDDRHWLPRALNGKKIRGFYVFDDDKMLSQKLVETAGFDGEQAYAPANKAEAPGGNGNVNGNAK